MLWWQRQAAEQRVQLASTYNSRALALRILLYCVRICKSLLRSHSSRALNFFYRTLALVLSLLRRTLRVLVLDNNLLGNDGA